MTGSNNDLYSRIVATYNQAYDLLPERPGREYESVLTDLIELTTVIDNPDLLVPELDRLNRVVTEINRIHGSRALEPIAKRAPTGRQAGSRRGMLIAAVVVVISAVGGFLVWQQQGDSFTPPNVVAGPAACKEKDLSEMKVGDKGYMYPWGAFKQKGRAWVNPAYPVSACTYATMKMPVELRPDGYHIWPKDGDEPEAGSMANYAGQASIKPRPAIVEH